MHGISIHVFGSHSFRNALVRILQVLKPPLFATYKFSRAVKTLPSFIYRSHSPSSKRSITRLTSMDLTQNRRFSFFSILTPQNLLQLSSLKHSPYWVLAQFVLFDYIIQTNLLYVNYFSPFCAKIF